MRISHSLVVASLLLMPLQAMAQGSTGSDTAGATTGIVGTATGAPHVRMPGPPGVNSAGTAQSSGSMTTGSAGGGSAAEARIRAEDSRIDTKIKSICRGC